MRKTIIAAVLMMILFVGLVSAAKIVSKDGQYTLEGGSTKPPTSSTTQTKNPDGSPKKKDPTADPRPNLPQYFTNDAGQIFSLTQQGGKWGYTSLDNWQDLSKFKNMEITPQDYSNYGGQGNYQVIMNVPADGRATVFDSNGKYLGTSDILDPVGMDSPRIIIPETGRTGTPYSIDNDGEIYSGDDKVGNSQTYYVYNPDSGRYDTHNFVQFDDGKGSCAGNNDCILNLDNPDEGQQKYDKDNTKILTYFDLITNPFDRQGSAETDWIFLNALQSGLSGYSWESYFYDPEDEGAWLKKHDNAFFKFILNGPKDTFLSQMCKEKISDTDDERTVTGGAQGGSANAWMAAEKTAYFNYNTSSRRNQTGFIYKINAQAAPGSCSFMYAQLLIVRADGQILPLIVSNNNVGQAYNYQMGTDQADSAIDFSGYNAIVFFSQQTYTKTCIRFTRLSAQCLEGIYEVNGGSPYDVCWKIATSDRTVSSIITNNVGAAANNAATGTGSTPQVTASGSGNEADRGSPVLNTL